MAKYCASSEQTYRNNIEAPFDFAGFNSEPIKDNCSGHLTSALGNTALRQRAASIRNICANYGVLGGSTRY